MDWSSEKGRAPLAGICAAWEAQCMCLASPQATVEAAEVSSTLAEIMEKSHPIGILPGIGITMLAGTTCNTREISKIYKKNV